VTTAEKPVAKIVKSERTHHGDTVVDEYAWLANKEDPDTVAYLKAENAYTEAATEHLAGLRSTIFGEIKSRTKETDLSVPARKGGYWYYSTPRSTRRGGRTRCGGTSSVPPPTRTWSCKRRTTSGSGSASS
jgi:oligopeptidase B